MKLSVITNDPIADWNRYCEMQGEVEKVKCSVCSEEFPEDGARRICPSCEAGIKEEIKEIFDNYTAWGAEKYELTDIMEDAVDSL